MWYPILIAVQEVPLSQHGILISVFKRVYTKNTWKLSFSGLFGDLYLFGH